MNQHIKIGNNLKHILKDRKMSYMDLAIAMGNPRLYDCIKGWGSNRNPPSRENAKQLCKVLQLKMSDLFYFID